MLKKLLPFLLGLLLLPTFAMAADFDPAAYSQEELTDILRETRFQLLMDYTETEPNLLYEDDSIAMYYSSFDREGEHIYS